MITFFDFSTDNKKPKLTKGFKYGQLNINGLLAHIDQLRVLMTDYQFDVLAINETKLDHTFENMLRIQPSENKRIFL